MVGYIGRMEQVSLHPSKCCAEFLCQRAAKSSERTRSSQKSHGKHPPNRRGVWPEDAIVVDVPVIESLRLSAISTRCRGSVQTQLDLFMICLTCMSFRIYRCVQLSLGQRLRADLAAALLHNPRAIFGRTNDRCRRDGERALTCVHQRDQPRPKSNHPLTPTT